MKLEIKMTAVVISIITMVIVALLAIRAYAFTQLLDRYELEIISSVNTF